MRRIDLTSRTELDWLGKIVDDSYYDQLIEDDAAVYKPDGTLLCVLVKKALSRESVAKAWSVFDKIKMKTDARGMATGIQPKKKVNRDGTLSNQMKVPHWLAVTSFVLGYFDRSVRYPFCRECTWNQQNPEKFAQVIPMIQEVDRKFAEFVPDRYAVQRGYADKTSADFKIADTVFTTITVNKDFRLACHKDAGDLKEGFGVITCIRRGKFDGGLLVLPDFRIAIKFDTTDILFFDVHEFHGNTAIRKRSEDAMRCTVVFYYREKMLHCGDANQELERVKNRKPGEPLNPAEAESMSTHDHM